MNIPSDLIKLGDWVVSLKTGFVKHLSCRRFCDKFNDTTFIYHYCDEADELLEIPEFVRTVALCNRKKV